MAKGEALKAQIEALRSAIPELKGVLLASNEGLPIAHSLSNGADPNRVAAMAAAASSLGRRISESMSAGTLGEVSIQSEEGALFVYSAGSKAVLAVVSPQGGNAGLIHLEARTAGKEIGHLFLTHGAGDFWSTLASSTRTPRAGTAPATRSNSGSEASR